MTFIDTGAFLARYLPNDQHHRVATALWNKIRTTHERCLTSNFVLDETITLLTFMTGLRKSLVRALEGNSLSGSAAAPCLINS